MRLTTCDLRLTTCDLRLVWYGLRLASFFMLTGMSACGSQTKPLDADTRQAIDSISNVQINLARNELDTLCKQRRLTELPHLVDSIKQKRLREIEEQLKTVPK